MAVDLMAYANYIEQSNKEAVRALKREIEVFGTNERDEKMRCMQ